MTSKNLRLIDANLNRLREGIRVIEDIFRYIFNNKEVALQLKQLRHSARIDTYKEDIYKKLIDARDINGDVLITTTKSEQTREELNSILIANFKRTQESSRVLEEFGKLLDPAIAQKFKTIRYELYDLEKNL